MVIPPFYIRFFYPGVTWHIPVKEKILYLTFDDGPIPEVTQSVIKCLDNFNAKATFFCIGDNVRKYPDVYKQLIDSGHRTGNHTFHHYNNWKVNVTEYLKDIEMAGDLIKSNLFRPPYGKLTPASLKALKKNYEIIMWDVISYDFDKKIPKEKVLSNVCRNAKPGSIVVFHDSIKARENVLYALPKTLEHFSNQGYRFESIPV